MDACCSYSGVDLAVQKDAFGAVRALIGGMLVARMGLYVSWTD